MIAALRSSLIALVLVARVSFADGPASSPATTQAGSTTKVVRGSIQRKFDSSAYFEPIDSVEVRIRPKVYNGELTISLIASNGAVVKKGAKLLVIDPEPLQKQLAVAESEAKVAHANLAKAEIDGKLAEENEAEALKNTEQALKDAEDGIKWWDAVDSVDMIRNNELERKSYWDNYADRADELDQLKKMYKDDQLTNATADIVVRRAIRGMEQSKTQAEMAENRVEKAETLYYPAAGRRVREAAFNARQSLIALKAAQAQAKIAREAGLLTSRTAVTAADEKVSNLNADMKKLTVTAPSGGVVWYGAFAAGNWQGGDAKALKVGEKIAAQQTVMTFYQPGKLRAVMDLAEAKYFSVPAGTKATLTPSGFPEMHLAGTCEAGPRTAVSTQGGPIYPLVVTLNGADAKLIPGMRASAQVDAPAVENVLVAPSGAVVSSAVWVKNEGGEEKRAVVTGRTDGKVTEIVSGLKEGDEVLTQGKP
jgi:multidrug resistance efflux pump